MAGFCLGAGGDTQATPANPCEAERLQVGRRKVRMLIGTKKLARWCRAVAQTQNRTGQNDELASHWMLYVVTKG